MRRTRNGNTPNDLSDDRRSSSGKSGRRNARADEDIDDDGGEEVKSGIGDLEEGESLGEVIGVLELGNDGEEARVTRWVRKVLEVLCRRGK